MPPEHHELRVYLYGLSVQPCGSTAVDEFRMDLLSMQGYPKHLMAKKQLF